MNVRYRVTLTDAERSELRAFLAGGKQPARKLNRAQILLAADAGQSDEAIAAFYLENLPSGLATGRLLVDSKQGTFQLMVPASEAMQVSLGEIDCAF